MTDVDMIFMPVKLIDLGHKSSFWLTLHRPAMKIYAERPGFLQLFCAPYGLFIETPQGESVQGMKQKICNALYGQGVAVPLPTKPPMLNYCNGSCVAQRTLKCATPQVQEALQSLGVDTVWLGQFGCKVPLSSFQDIFKQELDTVMTKAGGLDIALQTKDEGHIWLVGLPWGKATIPAGVIGPKKCNAYTHPILLGLFSPESDMVWGTLEIRPSGSGHAGSDKGKFIQCYAPMSHTLKAAGEYEMVKPIRMKGLRVRKQGFGNLDFYIFNSFSNMVWFKLCFQIRISI